MKWTSENLSVFLKIDTFWAFPFNFVIKTISQENKQTCDVPHEKIDSKKATKPRILMIWPVIKIMM